MNRTLLTLGVIGLLSLSSVPALSPAAHAQNAGGPGFLSTYKGPTTAGDLVVDSASVTYDGTNFTFTSTFDSPVGTTVGAYYVWGVNTGTGAAGFASLGATQDESKVLFNDVILAHPTVDSIALTPSLRSNGTTLPNSDMFFSGNTLTLIIPASTLPSTGFTPANYTANLWPRFEGTFNSVTVTGNAQISQFAPNNSNLAITNAAAPEPVPVALIASLIPGFAGGMVIRRRRRNVK